MATVGFGGFIPFVGYAEQATDYMLMAIVLGFLMVGVIVAMRFDSLPLRLTFMLACFGATYPLYDYGIMYSVFAILFGLAILARAVHGVFERGPEV